MEQQTNVAPVANAAAAPKTHWKKLQNPDYIGAYELMDGETTHELNVRILGVTKKLVNGPDGKQDHCTVAELQGHKPMILNATNLKTLTKLAGSPYIEDWNGVVVCLFVAKVKAFGDVVDALRIKAAKVATKPVLTPTHAKWNGAVKALASGNTTIEAILKAFDVSEQDLATLNASVKGGSNE